LQHRQISMNGEAVFIVAHDSLSPFKVITKDINVTVMGTEFAIRAWPKDSNTNVSVYKGKVLFVIPETKDSIQLNYGETGLYNQINKAIGFYKRTDTSYFSLKGRDIQFENVPMSDVIRVLTLAYKTSFTLENDAILNCPITATFTNRSLENIIDMVETILNVRCKKVGQTYIIKGNGC
jgi:transmembrane sensor